MMAPAGGNRPGLSAARPFDDAVMARRKSLALNGESGARYADLGEALTAAANGVVTDEAKQAFTSAVAHDQSESKAQYFSVWPMSKMAIAKAPPRAGAPCCKMRRPARRGSGLFARRSAA